MAQALDLLADGRDGDRCRSLPVLPPPLRSLILPAALAAADTSDLPGLRGTCRGACCAIGHPQKLYWESRAPTLLSPGEAWLQGEVFGGLSTGSGSAASRRQCDGTDEARCEEGDIQSEHNQLGSGSVRAIMRRCLGLLHCLQHDLEDALRGQCNLVANERAMRVTKAAASLTRAIEARRVRTASAFGIQVRSLLTEQMEVELEVQRMADRFESELLLVEVPEVDCGGLDIDTAQACRGRALFVEAHLKVECRTVAGTTSRPLKQLKPRWFWAEVVLLSTSSGLELSPRMCMARLDDSTEGHRVLSFRQHWSCRCDDRRVRHFLRALEGRAACQLMVVLRADWLALSGMSVRLLHCSAAATWLAPPGQPP